MDNIEPYIKDLSPELQEKARACKSVAELLELAKANRIAVLDEALEAAAGGKEKSDPNEVCPKSWNGEPHKLIFKGSSFQTEEYVCQYCGKQFLKPY